MPLSKEEINEKRKATWAKKKAEREEREAKFKADMELKKAVAKENSPGEAPRIKRYSQAKLQQDLTGLSDEKLKVAATARLLLRLKECREDPVKFAEFVMKDPKGNNLSLKDFHKRWLNTFNTKQRVIVECSRNHGKTSILISYLLWRIGRNPNIRIKLFSQNDTRAKERIAEIAENIKTNEAFQLVFPDIKPKLGQWSNSRIVVERPLNLKDATVEALGITTSATGGRCDIVALDDVCDLNNSVIYPTLRERIIQKFSSELLPILDPGGSVVSIATPYHNCIPDGEKVVTLTGNIAIETLTLNDKVQVAANEWQHPIAIKRTHYVGNIVSFTCNELGRSYKFTPNHRLPTQRGVLFVKDILPSDQLVHQGNTFKYYDISKIEHTHYEGYVTDIQTSTGYFDLPGITSHNSDLTAVLKANTEFTHIRDVVGNDTDPLLPLWPERWPREALQSLRIQQGSIEFDRAYRCIAISNDIVPCKPEWIKFYTKEDLGDPNRLICVQAYDLAIEQKTNADYFACVTVLYDPERNKAFVADATHDRLSFTSQGQRIVNNFLRWRPDRILIEKVGLGGSLENYLMENSPIALPIIPYKPRGDKYFRFTQQTPWLEDGRVSFHPSLDPQRNVIGDSGSLIKEMLEFPVGKHDDLCVRGDTLIRTSTGFKEIKDIVIGDEVVTHKGRFRKVKAVMQRQAKTFNVHATGHEDLHITPNHPMEVQFRPTRENQMIPRVIVAREFQSLNDIGEDFRKFAICAPVCHDEIISKIDLAPTAPTSYRLEDSFLAPYVTNICGTFKNPKGKIQLRYVDVTPDLAWFFGLWIAEGSVGAHNVSIASHLKETDVRDEVIRIITTMQLGKPVFYKDRNGDGCQLSFGNRLWAEYLRHNAGTCRTKHIPADWLLWPKELQFEFLIGYFVGDGHIAKSGYLSCVSSSKQLAYGIREMLLRLDIPCILQRDNRVAASAGEHKQWKVLVAANIATKLTNEINRRFKSKLFRLPASIVSTKQHNGYKLNDVYTYKFRSAIENANIENVYNLSVEEDESYLANGISVHNCDAFTMCMFALEEFRTDLNEPGWLDGGGLRAKMSVIG
jgi:phage terminase large subunit-like protein